MTLDHRAPATEPTGPTAGLTDLPLMVDNQPGFLERMLRAIAGRSELAGLTTREVDDPIIGLFDAAATMLDVVAFYNDRIGNEGFLRSADERRSVLELARGIGYELAPGVAASTALAFNVDPPPGSAVDVAIDRGVQAQKLPGADRVVAVYETSDDLIARKELNELRLQVAVPYAPAFGHSTVVLAGTGLGLSPGDALLVVGDERVNDAGSERWDLRRITGVTEVTADIGLHTDGAPPRTEVRLDKALGSVSPHIEPAGAHARCYHLTATGSLFGSSALSYTDLPISLRIGEANPDAAATPKFLPGPYAGKSSEWVDAALASTTTELWLDRIHQEIVAGSWMVLTSPTATELYMVTAAAHGNTSRFLMSGPSTKVTVQGENLNLFSVRSAVVLSGPRELQWGTVPVTGPITGSTIAIDGAVDGGGHLAKGRLLAVAGRDADHGTPISELVEVAAVGDASSPGLPATRITLRRALAGRYSPAGFRLRGNVVRATHGQTMRFQPIGSGDAGREFLSIPLSVGVPGAGPLTYTSADTPTGGTSSLELRVDGVRWDQVDSLAGQPADAQVYVVRHGEGATATVMFGDGRTGARPASGRDNIVAGYRVGLGAAGAAAVGQISLPLSLPLGVRDVINPIAATGGEDPESLSTARVNAPTMVRTLGRIVSVADYEDFARTFGGIGWASATLLDDRHRVFVHLTVTLADGTPLVDGSDLADTLVSAITRARHDDVPFVVHGHLPRVVDLRAKVRVDPRWRSADVLAAATTVVTGLFDRSPDLDSGGGFGKLLTPTRVLAALQRTPGVIGAVLHELRTAGAGGDAVTEVVAKPAAARNGTVTAAELLTPGTIDIGEVVP